MDILSVLILSTCVLVPYCGIMVLIAVISYRVKLKSAVKILRNVDKIPFDDRNSKNSTHLQIYILAMLALLLGSFCLLGIMIAHYLNVPLVSNIDVLLVGKAALIAILVITLATIIGSFLFNKLFKIRD